MQQRSNSNIILKGLQAKEEGINVKNLIDFEERVKNEKSLNKLMLMSPSVPSGFDLNSTTLNQCDFSTIICQALISNEHLIGLKE